MSQEPKHNVNTAKGVAVPSPSELQSLLDNARQSKGTKLQYAWSPPGGAKSFRLVVVVDDDTHEPRWSLKVVEGIEAREVWSEEIADLAVVRDVCLRHSPQAAQRPQAPPTQPTQQAQPPLSPSPSPQSIAPRAAVSPTISQQMRAPNSVPSVMPAASSAPVAQPELPPLPPPVPAAIHLAKVDDFKYAAEPSSELQALGEDGTGAEYLNTQLANPKSGFYEYASILKFLEHEYYRFEAFGMPCSLIIFDMLHKDPLSTDALTAAGLRISMMSRRVDRVGHFETHYALLLPATTQAAGGLIATRVLGALSAAPLAPGFDKSSIKFSFGVSGLPEDGTSIENLIIAAKLANNSARSLAFPVCVSGG